MFIDLIYTQDTNSNNKQEATVMFITDNNTIDIKYIGDCNELSQYLEYNDNYDIEELYYNFKNILDDINNDTYEKTSAKFDKLNKKLEDDFLSSYSAPEIEYECVIYDIQPVEELWYDDEGNEYCETDWQRVSYYFYSSRK